MEAARGLLKAAYRKIPFKRRAFELMRGRLPERLYRHLHFEGPFTIRIDGTRSFRMISAGDILENELFWRPFGQAFEGVSLSVWSVLAAQASGAILDIGANTGVYTLVACANRARQSDIFAFEPVPRVAARLRENLSLNGFSAIAIEKGLSDKAGMVPIYDTPGSMEYDASLERHHAPHTASYEIEVARLDDFLGGRSTALIKLDVEQHEPAVIRGAIDTITRHRPAILVETIFPAPAAELNDQFIDLGYLIFEIDERRGLVPTTAIRALRPPGSWNTLLITPAAFQEAGLERYAAHHAMNCANVPEA